MPFAVCQLRLWRWWLCIRLARRYRKRGRNTRQTGCSEWERNNAATSQFTLAQRFGNTASGKSLYNFMLNVRVDNSALDARSYSLAGVNTSKPQTSQITGGFALQGPLKIPGVLRNGPNIFVGYQRTQNSVAVTQPGLVPDAAVTGGDLSGQVNAQDK